MRISDWSSDVCSSDLFRQAAARVIAAHSKTWRNEKHEKQWLQTLESYVFPHIGHVQVHEITGPMIRNLLSDIRMAKPETARRVDRHIGGEGESRSVRVGQVCARISKKKNKVNT